MLELEFHIKETLGRVETELKRATLHTSDLAEFMRIQCLKQSRQPLREALVLDIAEEEEKSYMLYSIATGSQIGPVYELRDDGVVINRLTGEPRVEE